MTPFKKYWSLFNLLHSRKSKSETRLITDEEFIGLTRAERTAYVLAFGVQIGQCKIGNVVVVLFKCPLFYAEWEYDPLKDKTIGWVCFTGGWNLDKYLDLININDALPVCQMNEQTINIVYICELKCLRQAIPAYLAKNNFKTVIAAEAYGEVRNQIPLYKIDVIVLEYDNWSLDINSLVSEISKDYPNVKLLVAGTFVSLETAQEFIINGADGYFDNHCTGVHETLPAIIRRVKDGEIIVLPSPNERTYTN